MESGRLAEIHCCHSCGEVTGVVRGVSSGVVSVFAGESLVKKGNWKKLGSALIEKDGSWSLSSGGSLSPGSGAATPLSLSPFPSSFQ